MPYGPCVGCGAMNYSNSMGGPHICPACDCGYPPHVGNPGRVKDDLAVPVFLTPMQGCICPPTSEQTCRNPMCPRGGALPFIVT
jgi:hypothetical protein